MRDQENLYLGTSGWSYASWEGVFYPPGVKSRDYLAHYVRQFRVIEIDSTFYAVPRPQTVQNWRGIAPEGFLFCPKFPRDITHEKRLLAAEAETTIFLDTMSMLEERLGPLILQFEYNFGPEHFDVLEAYLRALPSEFRYAVEIRNKKWLSDRFYEMLEQQNVALVQSDLYYMPRILHLTTDLTIIRLLGDRRKIPDDDFSRLRLDRGPQLDFWAERIRSYLEQGVKVFTFSNNRFEGHAPGTIRRLWERLN